MRGCSSWVGLLLLAALTSNTASADTTTADNDSHSKVSEDHANHNDTLAIGLSFRETVLPPHPLTGHAEENTVILMTCHYAPAADELESPTTSTRCCTAMVRAAQAAQKKDAIPKLWSSLLSQITEADASSRCEEEGSVVPPTKSGDRSTLRFTYYAATIPTERQQQQRPRNSNLYVWNAGLQQQQPTGVWLDELSLGLSLPTWVTPFVSLSPDNDSYNSLPSISRLPVDFRSILSQSGGMHRSLDHTLVIPLEDILPTLAFAQSDNDGYRPQQLSLEASFVLVIPRGMFMDAEDAFDEHRWSVAIAASEGSTLVPLADEHQEEDRYDLSLQTENIMDIEQPAFDSPQHAVLVTLQWTSSSTDNSNNDIISALQRAHSDERVEDASLVFQFTTKVHLRYPSPVPVGASLYQPVLLLPPIWSSGRLSLVQEEAVPPKTLLQLQGSSPWNLFGYEPSFASNSKDDGKTTTRTTTWVAAAPQDDFVLVATLTVLCSLLGAMMLGYETSTIVHE